jgi:hypothetical protein
MVPSSRKVKVLQWLITATLLLVLVGIAALYVMYGMNRAKQQDVTGVETPVEIMPADTPADIEMARRMKVLEDLASQSSSTLSESERVNVLENMVKESEQSTSTKPSTEERLKTLESLESSNETESTVEEEIIN